MLIAIGWIALAALVLGLYVVGLPPRWDELRLEFQHHVGFDSFPNSAGDMFVSLE